MKIGCSDGDNDWWLIMIVDVVSVVIAGVMMEIYNGGDGQIDWWW